MSSKTYRYYRLDRSGRLYGAEWCKADSDEAILATVAEKHPDATCEIWQDRRLVAKVSPRDVAA